MPIEAPATYLLETATEKSVSVDIPANEIAAFSIIMGVMVLAAAAVGGWATGFALIAAKVLLWTVALLFAGVMATGFFLLDTLRKQKRVGRIKFWPVLYIRLAVLTVLVSVFIAGMTACFGVMILGMVLATFLAAARKQKPADEWGI